MKQETKLQTLGTVRGMYCSTTPSNSTTSRVVFRESMRKRLQCGRRVVKDPEIEERLYKWVREERSSTRPVSRAIMFAQAKRFFAEKNVEFTQPQSWISRFMAFYDMIFTTKTSNYY